jgi:hypothetical protein
LASERPEILTTLSALIETCFPQDDSSPTADDLGILDYFQRNVLEPKDDPRHSFAQPPFNDKAPRELGWQSEISQAEYFVTTLQEIETWSQRAHGAGLAELGIEERQAVVSALFDGAILDGINPPASVFLSLLTEGIVAATLRDPHFGGNREGRGWSWLGIEPRRSSARMRVRL